MSDPAQSVTVKTAWKTLTQLFKDANVDMAVADARLLVQWVTGLSHEDLLMNGTRVLTDDELAQLAAVSSRRLQSEPVSRIIGRRAFWKSEFIVTPDTLDPRMDSETLIEAALTHVHAPARVLDCGTGTGCLLISLLMEYRDATGVGIDISAGAVDVAARNAVIADRDTHQVSGRAAFIATGWDDYTPDETFDLVISNPPYIALSEKDSLADDVALYDPPQALFGGADGLDAYRALLRRMPYFLKEDGALVLEIGYRQADAVKELLAVHGYDVIELRRDLGGNDRAIVAKPVAGAFAKKH